ncbi:hypothetical protein DASC09_035760 [Saccharomycopsis crataegensis]|uniref:Alcohol dehydrogenase n=1 Tax=Saccharomycopsis crataegensis TaxID=43959 RepID=A0AAV5QNG6_9ASCO|nr:hypothetical protein DASC09_035760 [Saccharomycopsis crataegensis]
MMKALVFQNAGNFALKSIPKPQLLTATDAIVKIISTTICGTDLHILKGDVPESIPCNGKCNPRNILGAQGLVLGHEGIAVIESVGSQVSDVKVGDKVIISCITSCGNCYYCSKNLQSHCMNGGGWILGHEIDGTQAEYVRIPFADHSLYKVPAGVSNDKALLMLSDVLPTGNEVGSINGNIKPGDVVAIIGSGPVGIAVLVTCRKFKPKAVIMIDLDDQRLKVAQEKFRADYTLNSKDPAEMEKNLTKLCSELTNGISKGVDVAVECVGAPATFEICENMINPGGRIANVGVHGSWVKLALEKLWIRNIQITTGLVNAYTTDKLLAEVVNGHLNPKELVTHEFKLEDIEKAYNLFANASKNKVIKTFITA